MNSKPVLAIAGILLATVANVQAIPISGSVDIAAFLSHAVIDKTANTVTFVDDAPLTPENAIVNNATGDFVPFLLAPSIYESFTYSPLAVANPIWHLVAGGLSFDLSSITTMDEAGVGLVLTGMGVIHAVGYDPTPGLWSFSADTPTGPSLTFSSRTVAAAVPEGGVTVLLLGLGLSSLALVRRKLAA